MSISFSPQEHRHFDGPRILFMYSLRTGNVTSNLNVQGVTQKRRVLGFAMWGEWCEQVMWSVDQLQCVSCAKDFRANQAALLHVQSVAMHVGPLTVTHTISSVLGTSQLAWSLNETVHHESCCSFLRHKQLQLQRTSSTLLTVPFSHQNCKKALRHTQTYFI